LLHERPAGFNEGDNQDDEENHPETNKIYIISIYTGIEHHEQENHTRSDTPDEFELHGSCGFIAMQIMWSHRRIKIIDIHNLTLLQCVTTHKPGFRNQYSNEQHDMLQLVCPRQRNGVKE